MDISAILQVSNITPQTNLSYEKTNETQEFAAIQNQISAADIGDQLNGIGDAINGIRDKGDGR